MPVIRDAFGAPYIPGSSLKGKLRSLWEKWTGAEQNQSIGRDVSIHLCKEKDAYERCDVCPIYGTVGNSQASAPTRLTARDIPLYRESLKGTATDLPFAEVKWEAAIDRVTSAATPRQLERVPAGAVFCAPDGEAGEILVFSFYEVADVERFGDVLTALHLVEDDYLGGQGSRGSGKVAFIDLEVICKGRDYDHPQRIATAETLQALLAQKDGVRAALKEQLDIT
jgi:CRISPR-associated protein Csm3